MNSDYTIHTVEVDDLTKGFKVDFQKRVPPSDQSRVASKMTRTIFGDRLPDTLEIIWLTNHNLLIKYLV